MTQITEASNNLEPEDYLNIVGKYTGLVSVIIERDDKTLMTNFYGQHGISFSKLKKIRL